jgi:hypothetical protein
MEAVFGASAVGGKRKSQGLGLQQFAGVAGVRIVHRLVVEVAACTMRIVALQHCLRSPFVVSCETQQCSAEKIAYSKGPL